ncbi:uncharacterized protein G2W53_028519 [Senna tora]|uniref:Uncharacterized protein n=1 Tax=Senna tora TaxID=362788 RepID=A0A834W8U7_9FABA|nr:uncharacterized protein G2W53_028519 [Senna tora]
MMKILHIVLASFIAFQTIFLNASTLTPLPGTETLSCSTCWSVIRRPPRRLSPPPPPPHYSPGPTPELRFPRPPRRSPPPPPAHSGPTPKLTFPPSPFIRLRPNHPHAASA